MTDQLRKGQRIVNYAYLKADIKQSGRIPPIETWLWNLPDHEFDKVMEWRLE
jgi:hypothetical protein